MNAYELGLDQQEINFINERYPLVDCENLEKPIMGLSSINSLDYLDSSIRFDLENNGFSKSINPEHALKTALAIRNKIDILRKTIKGK